MRTRSQGMPNRSGLITDRGSFVEPELPGPRLPVDFPRTASRRALVETKRFICEQADTSQIRLDLWSRGLVVLPGDTAFCPSLLAGQRFALAMTGPACLRASSQGQKENSSRHCETTRAARSVHGQQ